MGHALLPRTPSHDPADENEIIVLERERPGTVLPLRDQPDLGRTTVVTPDERVPSVKRTSTRLADGREILYYDTGDGAARAARAVPDTRPLDAPATTSGSEVRRDPLLGDRVVIASHRQGRTYHPPADACPLCPSTGERASEIPAPDYEVAVFENRFPSLAGDTGRCEVICFTPDHLTSFADLDEERAALVLAAWSDRTAELSAREGVQQVYCFENRGTEIGVTLGHPHGQIYAFPFVTPRTTRMLATVAAHRERTGGNLFEEVLAAERAEGTRIVLETEHWTAFVPYAARWPYEVHLYPRHRVPDLPALGDAARAEFPGSTWSCCAASTGSSTGPSRPRTSPPGTRPRRARAGPTSRSTWSSSRSAGRRTN